MTSSIFHILNILSIVGSFNKYHNYRVKEIIEIIEEKNYTICKKTNLICIFRRKKRTRPKEIP